MEYKPFTFKSDIDGLTIDAMALVPDAPIKYVVQILHGMCEYKDRYYPFMEYLAGKGCLCVIHDHRGHGNSLRDESDLGFFYDAGVEGFVEDTRKLQTMVKEKLQDLPYIFIAHSMGSMIARCYLKKYDYCIDKLVLLGSPSKVFGTEALLLLRPIFEALKGPKGHSKFLEDVVNSAYEKKFKEENLLHAWMTTDREIVEWFNDNPKCNFTFTVSGYMDLGKLNVETYNKKGWELKNPGLDIKFLSGNDDPCMINRKCFGKSVRFLKNRGYFNVSAGLYKGMRHEILNEKGKKRVYKDIYEFISK